MILNGDPEEYLKNVTGSHGLEDYEGFKVQAPKKKNTAHAAQR